MRITVIVSDATHAIHAGGEIERRARTFDMPPEMEEWIYKASMGDYASLSLAIEDMGGDEKWKGRLSRDK